MSYKRLKEKAKKSQIKVTKWTGYLVEWKEHGRSMDCVCENLRELDERIKHIEAPLKEQADTKKAKSKKLLKKMEPWLRKRMQIRTDGRLQIKRCDLPKFPDGKDKLPNPIEIDGKQVQWVGIGFTDHGKATGDEPLVIVEDE